MLRCGRDRVHLSAGPCPAVSKERLKTERYPNPTSSHKKRGALTVFVIQTRHGTCGRFPRSGIVTRCALLCCPANATMFSVTSSLTQHSHYKFRCQASCKYRSFSHSQLQPQETPLKLKINCASTSSSRLFRVGLTVDVEFDRKKLRIMKGDLDCCNDHCAADPAHSGAIRRQNYSNVQGNRPEIFTASTIGTQVLKKAIDDERFFARADHQALRSIRPSL